jgi:hypothetical protein
LEREYDVVGGAVVADMTFDLDDLRAGVAEAGLSKK